METKLLYLEEMQQYTCEARVAGVEEAEGKTFVVLDQTIFYPQGGGQPFDQGTITGDDKSFNVTEVRFVDGVVRHFGHFLSEPFAAGEAVTCSVDPGRRQLHTRLHAAGHLVDMGLKRLGIPWVPGKGYHFPNGPYVEYTGGMEVGQGDEIRAKLEEMCNQIIAEGIETKVLFMPKEEMYTVCPFVPDYLPAGKPSRVVMYGDFGIPCGGTHPANLQEIGKMLVKKIKPEKGVIRVSYAIEPMECI